MNWSTWIRQTQSLGVHCLYADCHRQLHRPGTGRRYASALGDLLAAAPARLASVHRPVHVRAAVCHEVAPRVRRLIIDRPAAPRYAFSSGFFAISRTARSQRNEPRIEDRRDPSARAVRSSPWAPLWTPPVMPKDGRVVVKATFDDPGTYVLRGLADDGALFGGDSVTVTVTK